MKTVAFTACDINNLKYAKKLIKSFKYFHPDVDFVLFTNAKEDLPDVRVVDISGDISGLGQDIWYLQKPYFANKLFLEGYQAVLGMDSDMIILGDLDVILKPDSYDLGTVLNFNPLDMKIYGQVSVANIHFASEYFNCGLVMMRNHKLVKHWLKICRSNFFKRFQYREQDIMNLIAWFGEYDVRCFDDADQIDKYFAWHGMLGSSETLKCVMRGRDIVIPKDEQTGYPSVDVKFKVWHPAGGQTVEDKLNYKLKFPEPVIKRIDEILK